MYHTNCTMLSFSGFQEQSFEDLRSSRVGRHHRSGHDNQNDSSGNNDNFEGGNFKVIPPGFHKSVFLGSSKFLVDL